MIFPDQETSLWTYDRKAKQYFLHKFYKHQPDLNVANPAVRDEIARVMGFWMELGLSGFRVDAVPFLLEAPVEALPDPHDYLGDLRAFLSRRNGEAVLLGEVNLPYTDTMKFFGGADGVGDELHLCFDFIGMQQLYLSLARQQASPLAHALKERPQPPRDCHWATFVRNHDELTLDKLTVPERQEVFAAFGPEEDMQLYGRGLRRRLPSMLGGDLREDQDGLQPAVLAARHAGAVLRRGGRHDRGPVDPRAARPYARRCGGTPRPSSAATPTRCWNGSGC